MKWKRPLAAAASLAGLWALWRWVDPSGDFPVNDEWTYAFPVRHWVSGEGFHLCQHASLPGLPPILIGALFAKIFGFSYPLLRFTSLLWGGLAAFFLHRILRDEGVDPSRALLTSGLLLFNPIFFYLSLTFHMDVPFTALMLGAVLCYLRGERTDSSAWDIGAGLLASAATMTRQPGVLIFIGMFTARLITSRRPLLPLALSALPVPVFYSWIYFIHGPTWAMQMIVGKEGVGVFSPGVFRRLVCMSLTLAFFSVPLWWGPFKHTLKTFLILGITVGIAMAMGPWPLFMNTLHTTGLGHVAVFQSGLWKTAGLFWSSPWIWAGLSVVAGVALAWALVSGHFGPWRREETRLGYAALPPAYALLSRYGFFDRYLMPSLAGILAMAALRRPKASPSPTAWLFLLLMGGVSLAGSRDYFAWNRAKWELGRKALKMGYRPDEVSNGIDWAAYWFYEDRMNLLMKAKPASAISEMEWKQIPFPKAFITFNPALYPASHLLAVQRYRSPLGSSTAALYLHRSST